MLESFLRFFVISFRVATKAVLIAGGIMLLFALSGAVLGALAVQFVIDGIKASFG